MNNCKSCDGKPKSNYQCHHRQECRFENFTIQRSQKISRREILRSCHKLQTTHQQWELEGQIGICKNYWDELQKLWKKDCGLMKPRLIPIKMMEKPEWGRKESAYDPKHKSLYMKHDVCGVLTLVCIAASGRGLFICNDVAHNGISRMNSEDKRKTVWRFT